MAALHPFRYTHDISEPMNFLKELSEHYANAYYYKDSPKDILAYAEQELSRIPSIATYINTVHKNSGESEMTYVFGWECTDNVELMAEWFNLMRRLGGDVHLHRNRNGRTAMEVACERLHSVGYTQEQMNELLH
jgi:hypothetical protein